MADDQAGVLTYVVHNPITERVKIGRTLGEWFAVEPELAAWMRTSSGYRLRAARERRPRPPAPDVQDVALGLEALTGLALREPELVDMLDYLAAEFGPDSPRARAEAAEKPDTDAEPEDEETEWVR